MEILEKLGIDGRLFLAQLVNFGILLYLLHRFVYRPILTVLEKRQATIEKSLADARAIEEQMAETKALSADIMHQAKQEAAALLEHAEQLSEQKRRLGLEKTKEEIGKIVADAKEKIALEREEMVIEARSQVAELVLQATKKVVEQMSGKQISPDVVQKIVNEAKSST
jgi:F-type H+-transporting ATPase subunit b